MNPSPFLDWIERSCGEWRSERRYIYFGSERQAKAQTIITTYFGMEPVDGDVYRINWESWTHKDLKGAQVERPTTGEMLIQLKGNLLERNVGYFTDAQTSQAMERIDDDTVVFRTEYDGQYFREEIRFVDNNTRLRQTIGFKGGELILSGQYTETRIA